MIRPSILALVFFVICVVLGIVSVLVYRRLLKKTKEDSDPSSKVIKTINKLFLFFFVLFIVFLFVWLLPLIINMKSFFEIK